MRYLMVGVFKHLDIKSKLGLDIKIKYMERILIWPALNKFRQALECKELAKGLTGDQRILGLANSVTMDQFGTWSRVGRCDNMGDPISGSELSAYFEKEFWFNFGKSMGRKHWSIFQDHVKYIHNDIVKPFRLIILQYAERARDMHNLAKYTPPPSMKGDEYDQ